MSTNIKEQFKADVSSVGNRVAANLQQFFGRGNTRRTAFIAFFALVATLLLLFAMAAGNFFSLEVEEGLRSGQATVVNDTQASGGAAIEFIGSTPTPGCSVTGGTSSSPANLSQAIANTSCTVFNLADGYYSSASITRSGITIKAVNACKAVGQSELAVNATNVTIDGLSFTGNNTAITVYKSGAKILNNCISNFGKTGYANAIWVFKEALDPANKILIQGNKLDNWGGAQFSGGIAIGMAADDPSTPSAISVDIIGNTATNGPTASGIYNSPIQIFHPAYVHDNYVDRVSSAGIQNKAFGSIVSCNELTNVTGDGALYNRDDSNNVWEYNIVHDSEFGLDHFMGNNTIFRKNIFYNNQYNGRVKDQGIGSTNLTFENNIFYGTTGWASFIWDATSGAPLSNITWKNNIFMNINGSTIANENTNAWDEFGNIYWNAQKPTGTTGASNGTSLTMDPNFVSPVTNWTVQNSSAQGKGAPWPLPCP